MDRALVIEHIAIEGLGIIAPALAAAGIEPEFVRLYRRQTLPRTAEGYSALIVMGGPMGVYESDRYPFISKELRLIESALKSGVPVLGVCLGAQLLARAAGGRVYPSGKKEIGWYKVRLTDDGLDERLLSGLPEEMTVFQWHGDTFDIPEGSVNLASSELIENQLIKAGPRAYGVQFHLEVTEPMVYQWIRHNAAELEGVKGVIDPEAIIRETPSRIADLHRHGRALVSRFLSLARR